MIINEAFHIMMVLQHSKSCSIDQNMSFRIINMVLIPPSTKCGPPPTYCNKSESCHAKLDKSLFVPGLAVNGYVAIPKVRVRFTVFCALIVT
jgi:hypothetical protein